MKYILLFALALSITSCYEADLGIITTERHVLAGFDELQVNGIGDVFIHPDNDFALEIETHDDIQDDIVFSVQNGILKLDEDLTDRQERSIDKLELHVFVPTLTDIELNGVGDISCPAGFDTYRLYIELDGVGDIDLRNMNIDDLVVVLEGVGDVRLTGDADDATYQLKDVGDIQCFQLRTNSCEAELTGVGDIELWATDELDARAHGVGNIYYRGDPDISKSETTTSKVINAN